MNNIFSLYDVEKLELKNYNLQRYLDIKKKFICILFFREIHKSTRQTNYIFLKYSFGHCPEIVVLV